LGETPVGGVLANRRNERRKRERARQFVSLKEKDPALYRAAANGFIQGRIRDMRGVIKDPDRLACDLAECGVDPDIDSALEAGYQGLADIHMLRPRPTRRPGVVLT